MSRVPPVGVASPTGDIKKRQDRGAGGEGKRLRARAIPVNVSITSTVFRFSQQHPHPTHQQICRKPTPPSPTKPFEGGFGGGTLPHPMGGLGVRTPRSGFCPH